MILWISLAIFADFISPYDPYTRVGKSKLAPCAQFIMGTDMLGRDVMSRILFGSRISMVLGFISVSFSSILGTILGLIAGFYEGKWIDTVIMRIMDSLLAFLECCLLS